MSLVDAQGGPFDVHFGEQKKPIFLLDESAGRRATFFASSSDAVRLIEMQGLHRRQVQEQRVRERDLIKKKAELDDRLVILKPLTPVEQELGAAEKAFEAISEQTRLISSINSALSSIGVATARLNRHVAETEALATLVSPPELQPTGRMADLIDRIKLYAKSADYANAQVDALVSLQAPPRLEPTEPLQQLIDQIEKRVTEVGCNGAMGKALASLLPPPTLEDEAALATTIKDIGHAVTVSQASATISGALKPLSPPPVLIASKPLFDLILACDAWHHHLLASRTEAELLTTIAEPPQLDNADALCRLIDHLAVASRSVETEDQRRRLFNRLEEPKQPIDNGPLHATIEALRKQHDEISNQQENLQKAESARSEAEQELRQAVEESGTASVSKTASPTGRRGASSPTAARPTSASPRTWR